MDCEYSESSDNDTLVTAEGALSVSLSMWSEFVGLMTTLQKPEKGNYGTLSVGFSVSMRILITFL